MKADGSASNMFPIGRYAQPCPRQSAVLAVQKAWKGEALCRDLQQIEDEERNRIYGTCKVTMKSARKHTLDSYK